MKKFFKIIFWTAGSLIGLIVLFLLTICIYSGNTPEGGTQIAKKGWARIGGKLYHAYIGIGQVCNQLESERQSYGYIVAKTRKAGDTKTVEIFESYDKYADDFPSKDYLLKVRTNSMNKYGVGIRYKDRSMFDIAIDLLYYRGYTLTDKFHYLQGALFSLNNMFHRIIKDNLFESSIQFDVPVYIIQGKYDYQVSYHLAKAYLDSIDAPQKSSSLSRIRHTHLILKSLHYLST